MTIPRVSEGDRITAGWANKLTDGVNSGLSPTFSGGQIQTTDSGVAFLATTNLTIALFEIVDDWTYPDSGTDDPTPFTENAKRMILTRGSTGADQDNIYKHTTGSQVLFQTETIYAPTTYRDGAEVGFGPRPSGPASRVWCQFSNETSRWELLSPATVLWAFAVLDEDLNAGSTATASLWIWDGAELADTGDNIIVTDWLLGDGAKIESGERVFIEFSPDSGTWYVIPTDATSGAYIAKPQSAGGIPAITRGTPDVAGSDTCDIYKLNDDDEIVAESGVSEKVFNITDTIIPQDWVLIVRTKFGKWIAVPPGGDALIKWAKVQSGFTNQSGAANRTVSVKTCDFDGTNVEGSAFNVVTPIRANKDTALFLDYVVGYFADDDGNLVVTTDCFDDPVGTIREVNADAAIRDGWRLCDGSATSDLRGKFTVGFDTGDADYNAIGDTGGNADHGADTNDHTDHDNFTHSHAAKCQRPADTNADNLQEDFWGWTDGNTEDATDSRDLGHTTTDNRPPYFTVKKIERFE